MRKAALLLGAALVAAAAHAGDLVPPAGPADPASARFTLGDLHARLTTGAAGTKRTGAFVEPLAGPTTATMFTTDDLMAAAPAADDVSGATAADVAAGKTFWGLRTPGGWGLLTGTGIMTLVPKTGLTQCWSEAGVPVGCAGTGQDGEYQKGAAWPAPRFTINGNGTVTDRMTGLVWLADAGCLGSSPWGGALVLANALAAPACGLTDGSVAGQWRLPNRLELESLVATNYHSPTISNAAGTGQMTNGDPFLNVALTGYWSSTTLPAGPTNAWSVWFDFGDPTWGPKTLVWFVWPVRDGP